MLAILLDSFRRGAKPKDQRPRFRNTPGHESGARRSANEEGARFFTLEDLLTGIQLISLAPTALFTAKEHWPEKARRFAEGVQKHFPNQLLGFSDTLPGVLTRLTGKDKDQLGREAYEAYLIECFEILAANFNRLDTSFIKIIGVDKLSAARNEGHGAVLWMEKAFSCSLLAKAGLAAEGFPLHHLSAASHGFSDSYFGITFLNQICRRAEDKFLAERIRDSSARQTTATRRIRELLDANQFVSITVADTGTQLTRTEVLDGAIHLATGAPHFALRSGAPLLPVFSYRDGPSYIVQIGEPIVLNGMARKEAFDFAGREFARQMEAYVREHPQDWGGWYGGTYSENDPPLHA